MWLSKVSYYRLEKQQFNSLFLKYRSWKKWCLLFWTNVIAMSISITEQKTTLPKHKNISSSISLRNPTRYRKTQNLRANKQVSLGSSVFALHRIYTRIGDPDKARASARVGRRRFEIEPWEVGTFRWLRSPPYSTGVRTRARAQKSPWLWHLSYSSSRRRRAKGSSTRAMEPRPGRTAE